MVQVLEPARSNPKDATTGKVAARILEALFEEDEKSVATARKALGEYWKEGDKVPKWMPYNLKQSLGLTSS